MLLSDGTGQSKQIRALSFVQNDDAPDLNNRSVETHPRLSRPWGAKHGRTWTEFFFCYGMKEK
jgi:hypothetical protein